MLRLEDYVVSVSESLGKTKKETREILAEFKRQLISNTASGHESQISGLGTFGIKNVEAATKRNPSTGEPVFVEAHKRPKFKFSNKIKEELKTL